MLRMFWVCPLPGPYPKLVLFWNGMVMMSPTGFWEAFASASLSSGSGSSLRAG